MPKYRYFTTAHGSRFEGHHPKEVKDKVSDFELEMRLPSTDYNIHDRFTFIIQRLKELQGRQDTQCDEMTIAEAVEALEQV
ncbi:MAG: hypothetical protein CL840_16270 [Crocinitomicaceae bacterium]|nr:hypothetical protein [Crocinitomicaceae bacterium]|tara:strand:- start:6374 stop:6616 length:243 start_codon:yes stop_codon:yes gene_type:complete